jgi:hypothetical protein
MQAVEGKAKALQAARAQEQAVAFSLRSAASQRRQRRALPAAA